MSNIATINVDGTEYSVKDNNLNTSVSTLGNDVSTLTDTVNELNSSMNSINNKINTMENTVNDINNTAVTSNTINKSILGGSFFLVDIAPSNVNYGGLEYSSQLNLIMYSIPDSTAGYIIKTGYYQFYDRKTVTGTSNESHSIVFIKWLKDRFIICRQDIADSVISYNISYSLDGINFVDINTPLPSVYQDNINDMTYADKLGLYIAFSYNGRILTSTNLTTWTLRATIPGIKKVQWCESLNKLYGIANNTIVSSSNAINWTQSNYDYISDLAWSDKLGKFISHTYNSQPYPVSSSFYSSDNAIDWHLFAGPFSGSSTSTFKWIDDLNLFVGGIDKPHAFSSNSFFFLTDGLNYDIIPFSSPADTRLFTPDIWRFMYNDIDKQFIVPGHLTYTSGINASTASKNLAYSNKLI